MGSSDSRVEQCGLDGFRGNPESRQTRQHILVKRTERIDHSTAGSGDSKPADFHDGRIRRVDHVVLNGEDRHAIDARFPDCRTRHAQLRLDSGLFGVGKQDHSERRVTLHQLVLRRRDVRQFEQAPAATLDWRSCSGDGVCHVQQRAWRFQLTKLFAAIELPVS